MDKKDKNRQRYYARKTWVDANGKIPKDECGRSFHIHHIDSDLSNNNLDNLMCVSLQEHYEIHLRQGDKGACLQLARELKRSGSEKSQHARDHANNRVKNGTHNFCKEFNQNYDPTVYKWRNKKTGVEVKMTRIELIKTYGLLRNHVYNVVNGHRKSHKGWVLIRD